MYNLSSIFARASVSCYCKPPACPPTPPDLEFVCLFVLVFRPLPSILMNALRSPPRFVVSRFPSASFRQFSKTQLLGFGLFSSVFFSSVNPCVCGRHLGYIRFFSVTKSTHASVKMAKEQNFQWQQTMLRIKDPSKTLPFYQNLFNMTLIGNHLFLAHSPCLGKHMLSSFPKAHPPNLSSFAGFLSLSLSSSLSHNPSKFFSSHTAHADTYL